MSLRGRDPVVCSSSLSGEPGSTVASPSDRHRWTLPRGLVVPSWPGPVVCSSSLSGEPGLTVASPSDRHRGAISHAPRTPPGPGGRPRRSIRRGTRLTPLGLRPCASVCGVSPSGPPGSPVGRDKYLVGHSQSRLPLSKHASQLRFGWLEEPHKSAAGAQPTPAPIVRACLRLSGAELIVSSVETALDMGVVQIWHMDATSSSLAPPGSPRPPSVRLCPSCCGDAVAASTAGACWIATASPMRLCPSCCVQRVDRSPRTSSPRLGRALSPGGPSHSHR